MPLPAAAGPWRPFICTEQPGFDPGPASRLVTNRKLAHWDGHQRKAFRAHAGACCVLSEWPVSMATPPCIHLQPPALKATAKVNGGRRQEAVPPFQSEGNTPGSGRWRRGDRTVARRSQSRTREATSELLLPCTWLQMSTKCHDATDGCRCLSGFAFPSQTAEWKSSRSFLFCRVWASPAPASGALQRQRLQASARATKNCHIQR